ncbi:MAG: hypothetical protein CMD99_02365 [Gammaproteobacteria bacterium]|nr:hypothetical protein [Gammaproteobacteria bacterium]
MKLMYEMSKNSFYNVSIVIQGQSLYPGEMLFVSLWWGVIDPMPKELKNREEGISIAASIFII